MPLLIKLRQIFHLISHISPIQRQILRGHASPARPRAILHPGDTVRGVRGGGVRQGSTTGWVWRLVFSFSVVSDVVVKNESWCWKRYHAFKAVEFNVFNYIYLFVTVLLWSSVLNVNFKFKITTSYPQASATSKLCRRLRSNSSAHGIGSGPPLNWGGGWGLCLCVLFVFQCFEWLWSWNFWYWERQTRPNCLFLNLISGVCLSFAFTPTVFSFHADF